MNFSNRSVCFFAPVDDRDVLERSGFYSQDIKILNELGFKVKIATKFSELCRADLYFVWWWTWSFKPLVRAILHRKPVLITGTFNTVTYDKRSPVQRALIRFGLVSADANVFVSRQEKDWIDQRFPSSNSHYVPHIVDTEIYTATDGARGRFCFTTCWMALTNCQRKSMFELIAAIPLIRREVPDIRFVIAGELRDGGPQLRDMAERIGVGDAVEFLGAVSEDEKIRLMQTCQLYLQPSRYEGFGLAIAEAMACGAPVVTSAVGAVPEVVGDCGVYVDGTDPSSIADGVIRLLTDRDQRIVRGRDGRARMEQCFSLGRRKEGLREIISSII